MQKSAGQWKVLARIKGALAQLPRASTLDGLADLAVRVNVPGLTDQPQVGPPGVTPAPVDVVHIVRAMPLAPSGPIDAMRPPAEPSQVARKQHELIVDLKATVRNDKGCGLIAAM